MDKENWCCKAYGQNCIESPMSSIVTVTAVFFGFSEAVYAGNLEMNHLYPEDAHALSTNTGSQYSIFTGSRFNEGYYGLLIHTNLIKYLSRS